VWISYFFADLITSFLHCYYIDESFSQKKYEVKDDHLIVKTNVGYASCHHIFPSNWKDVSDTTLITHGFLTCLILFIMSFYFIKNPLIKLSWCMTILFLIFAVFTHKYAHEKLHNRYVPFFIDFLLEHNLFLSPKIHQQHHIENNYNWSLLNGRSDSFFNLYIHSLCDYFKECPIEEKQNNAEMYLKERNTDIIKIRFVGDIEGTFQCKLHNNLFVKL